MVNIIQKNLRIKNSETNKILYETSKKVAWNKGIPCSKSIKESISITAKQNFESGKRKPWHKGKTNVYSESTKRAMGNGRRGKTPYNKKEIDLEIIKKLYLEDKKSVFEIASIFDCAKGTIISRLKELKIYSPKIYKKRALN